MKKNAVKSIIAVLLACILATGLAACGSQATQPAEAGATTAAATQAAASGDATSQSGDPAAAADGPLAPYAEPVAISVGIQASAVQEFHDGDSYEENEWTRLIKDELNIDVDVAFTADITTDAFRNRMNVLLASGDFPDVVKFDNRTFFRQAVEAGYVADISKVFESTASDAVKAYMTNYPDSFQGVTVNGGLYAFPYINDNFHQCANLWIRDDWLANTGTKPPSTIDELVELAKTFTFGDPDKNGVDDTFGLCLADNVIQNNYGTMMGLIEAYGVPCYGDSGIFYRRDGKITFSYIQPEVKDALAVLRGMYEAGVIDKEFIVKDTSVLETDWAQGRIGMSYHMNWGTWHPFNIIYEESGVITRPYPLPTAAGREVKQGVQSNQTGEYFMISSKCKNPEAIVKILNLYEKTAISGTDEQFANYWADEQYRLCPIYIGIPTELYAPVLHEALAKGSSDGLAGTALQYYRYVTGFEDGSKAKDANAYGTWGQMFSNGSMKIDLDYKKQGAIVTNIMANDFPDIWIQNSSVLADMTKTAFVSIITGEKSLDSFDDYVKEWLAAGGQETLDQMEKLYPEN